MNRRMPFWSGLPFKKTHRSIGSAQIFQPAVVFAGSLTIKGSNNNTLRPPLSIPLLVSTCLWIFKFTCVLVHRQEIYSGIVWNTNEIKLPPQTLCPKGLPIPRLVAVLNRVYCLMVSLGTSYSRNPHPCVYQIPIGPYTITLTSSLIQLTRYIVVLG